MKTIKATGSIYELDGKNRVSINMSSIYTALIKEAAKCDNYASDVLYDIKHVEEELYENMKETSMVFFGFRDMGVDHNDYIKWHIEDDDLKETYRTICVIEIKKNVYEQYGSVRMYTHDGSVVVHANFYEPEEFNDVVELLEGWK